jgi:hypothetical protein
MSSIPEWWTAPYPQVASPPAATEYLNVRGSAITREEQDGQFVLMTGPQELFRAPTPDEVDAFLLGFALGHSICERFGPIGSPSFPTAAPPEAAAAPETQAVVEATDADAEVVEAELVVEPVETAEVVETGEPLEPPGEPFAPPGEAPAAEAPEEDR